MSSRNALVAAILGAVMLAGAGCGSGSDAGTTSVDATAGRTEPGGAVPTGSDTVEIATGTIAAPPATTTEPDAGDEEGIRVPARFTLADGVLTPARITVPPQLPIAVTVKARDGQAHEVLFSTVPPVTVEVPAGGPGTALIAGQRKGTYTVNVDGGPARPALVAVDDAGP